MKLWTYVVLIATSVLTACSQPTTITPTVSSDEAATNANQNGTQNINIKVDLPIYLKGVPSLLHPVVVSSLDKYVDKSFSGDKLSSYVEVGRDTLSGQMFNVVFEELQTGRTKPLFATNNQLIYQAHYLMYPLQTEDDKPEPDVKYYHHFIYQVQENLSQANKEDNLSLYISDDKGDGLKKLHPDGEYVLETRWIADKERYYFITKSDSNGDGKITLADKSHNYYVDFKDVANPVVKPYDFMPK